MEAKQWAVRGPGMPQKIVRADVELTEAQVKKYYLETMKFKASDVDRDPDLKWSIAPMSNEDIVKANLSWCLQESRRKNHRSLIQVKNGKIVEDKKEVVPVAKTRTKVDVSVTPSK